MTESGDYFSSSQWRKEWEWFTGGLFLRYEQSDPSFVGMTRKGILNKEQGRMNEE
jgi:hypothetical protein